MSEPEIWFEKWMWSYMPIHWKGWLLTIVTIAAAVAVMAAIYEILVLTGHRNLWFLSLTVVPLGIFGIDPYLNRRSRRV